MKTIGLIGGMSWESTAVYYRQINESLRLRFGGLRSARILLNSLDFADVVALQKAGRWDLAGDLLATAAQRLEAAGADCVLICTNTMHLVADRVADSLSVPLINIIDETASRLLEAGFRRPLLLATRYTMEQGFYAARMERHGISVTTPDEAGRNDIHAVIFNELCRGTVQESSRRRVLDLVEAGRQAGADSVILGCTEICLLVDPKALGLPGFDSTTIHSAAAVRFAIGSAGDLDCAA